MKNALYTVIIIVILAVGGCGCYYFIHKVSLENKKSDIEIKSFINQQIKECNKKYSEWIESNTLQNNYPDGLGFYDRYPGVTYSYNLNSCIGYFESLDYDPQSKTTTLNSVYEIINLETDESLYVCNGFSEDCSKEQYMEAINGFK